MIKHFKIIVEVDGDQHFKKHKFFKKMTLQDQMERDVYKGDLAMNNGCSVIRVLQMDVFRDTNQWRKKLLDAIAIVKVDGPSVVTLYKVK